MCVCIQSGHSQTERRSTSQLSTQTFIFRRRELATSPYYALGKAHTSHCTPRLPASTTTPDRGPPLCWVIRLAPLLQTPTLLQTPSHSEAQKIKGPAAAAFFNFGKTQCSLHSNVAKWCRDPLALGSPIQRGTSHTALPLPTAWFCV